MTLRSCVPACVTARFLPSAVQPIAQGLAAPRSTLSSSTVLMTERPGTSIRVRAAVFIQPRSTWVVGIWKRARLWVTAASRPSGETLIAQQPAAAGQSQTFGDLPRHNVDHAHSRRHRALVRPPLGQVMGDQQMAAVGRDVQRDRLAGHGDANRISSPCHVVDGHAVVKSIANIECLAVGRKHRAAGRVSGRGHRHDDASSGFEFANPARSRGTGHEQLGPVGAERQTRRLVRHLEATVDRTRRSIHQEDRASCRAGDVKPLAVGSGNHCHWREPALARRSW